MCHRYHIQTTRIDIAAALGLKLHGDTEWSQNDLYPLATVPVVISEDDEMKLLTMQWGLLPRWWKPSEKHKKPSSFQRMTFNARSETIDSKASYRDAFKQRRCLIPATEFYEGPKENAAFFRLVQSEVMFFAGLWESWQSQNETIESCTIVTTEANDLVAKYHPRNRMPVILPDENACRLWMSSDVTERPLLEELFQPLRDDLMSHRSVDIAIKKEPTLWD
jgi:putative SOS response-associated peptidase YedK